MNAQQIDEAFLLVIEHLPAVLLLVLVSVVIYLFAKDAINGMRRPFLNPDKWQPLQLVDKVVLTHNTRRFRFALPHEDQRLGLPLGRHISIKATDKDGKDVMRPYTPTSDNKQRGYVDFVIKVYPDGRMSQAMDALAIGDTLHFKGPKGRFEYQPGSKKAIGMLAGGTGITPMYQLIQAVLHDVSDPTPMTLIFGNLTEDDILMKRELDEFAAKFPHFKVHYVLNTPPAGWKGGAGFITAELMKELLPAPDEDVMILRCGPLPMMQAMEGHLNALGYSAKQQFQF